FEKGKWRMRREGAGASRLARPLPPAFRKKAQPRILGEFDGVYEPQDRLRVLFPAWQAHINPRRRRSNLDDAKTSHEIAEDQDESRSANLHGRLKFDPVIFHSECNAGDERDAD